jgi:hypothetical protein
MDVQESLDQAAAIQAERDAAERAAEQAAEHETFDAFWAEVKSAEAPRYERILGVSVRVPTSMTLRFRRTLEQLDIHGRDTSEEEVRQVLSDLFGPSALDAWTDAGMDDEQLSVVMAWAIACAGGREISWREAYDAVMSGKAPASIAKERALAAKTPSSTARSGGTGGRSRGGRSRRGSGRKR